MRTYLNAGFGHPIGIQDLLLIQQLGFSGVRQDCVPENEELLVREFADPRVKLRPLFLVNGGKMSEGPTAAGSRASYVSLLMYEMGVQGEIEVGNEPNIAEPRYRNNPSLLRESISYAREIMDNDPRLTETRLVVGGIMTTDKGGLDYLAETMRSMPPKVHVGYHTYRTTTKASTPHKGFRSREGEFHALKDIAGGRELWNTEIGWHTAPSKVGIFGCKTVKLNDDQVYASLQEEAGYNRRAGAKVFTVFQLNDGPGEHYEMKFGIRTVSLDLKPSAQIAQWVNA